MYVGGSHIVASDFLLWKGVNIRQCRYRNCN